TTEAPAQPEDTPATGDASVMVVFAAAAVLSVAAVVVIKKRER
ncbi:MAG: LPXTG cell wall anchor domain-containing protein, partial [Clostridia bacterium]|nr:LPXTG cell wall anchor domain-containing protein [Clostridia bacterium]